jgi:hypothetical protein
VSRYESVINGLSLFFLIFEHQIQDFNLFIKTKTCLAVRINLQMVSMNQLNAFGSNLDEMFQKTPTQQDEDDNNGT